MQPRLGINTGFAVNRFSEPEIWPKIIGTDLNIRFAQLTADMINPSLPDKIINEQLDRIKTSCSENLVQVTSVFTGAFTRVNHLAHPDPNIREFWIEWFKRLVDITVELGAPSMGSHFGIFTQADNLDPVRRSERREQNIMGWHEVGKYAKNKGLDYLTWEPMSISREQGETIKSCTLLLEDVNQNAPIPFKLCLDVDHGDVTSSDPKDMDPYSWLSQFASIAPIIHLKQSSINKNGHWPFTHQYNSEGKIKPKAVLDVLEKNDVGVVDLVLELSFREREPVDSTVIEVLRESVDFWRPHITNRS